LEALNIDISKHVRATVATHWDDDHIGGMAKLLERATSSSFVCSGALVSPQFKSILGQWKTGKTLPCGSGVDEFTAVLVELNRRSKDTKYPIPKLAVANKILWERHGEPSAELRALYPSDAAFVAAIARFSEIVAQKDGLRRRIPAIDGNHSSIVLSVRVANIQVLLGGDLERRADPQLGWLAVVGEYKGESHGAYKVSHHGSENGDCDEKWQKLIATEALSVTTPYVGGRTRLPKKTDCERILSRTPNSWLTARPIAGKFRLDDKAAEKTIREVTRQVQFGNTVWRCVTYG
jgi:hypothetical protein